MQGEPSPTLSRCQRGRQQPSSPEAAALGRGPEAPEMCVQARQPRPIPAQLQEVQGLGFTHPPGSSRAAPASQPAIEEGLSSLIPHQPWMLWGAPSPVLQDTGGPHTTVPIGTSLPPTPR